MIKLRLLLILFLILPSYRNSQKNVYHLSWKKDLVIVGAGVGLQVLGDILISDIILYSSLSLPVI